MLIKIIIAAVLIALAGLIVWAGTEFRKQPGATCDIDDDPRL